MNEKAKKYVDLFRRVKIAAAATVDAEGHPQARIINVMLAEDDGMYIVTSRGKPFYKQLVETGEIALAAMCPDCQSLKFTGKLRVVDKSWVDKVFAQNPGMNEVYPGESRYILDAFHIYAGHGEWFDLLHYPISRETLAAKLAAEGLSAIAVHMDVADEQEVEAGFDKMMETYGSCDLVMSNAGVQIVHPFEEYPFADWRKMMAIHADGAFLVSRAAYRRMKASGKGGRIVFTGSVQSFVGSKLKEPYNFAKHGVAGLAKAIAREGAEYGIYTYTICPSFIKTPLVEKQIPEQAASLGITEEEVVKNIMLRDTVDGVFTTVEDVANTLVFLSKDQGALTGQSLRLTHGWAMM